MSKTSAAQILDKVHEIDDCPYASEHAKMMQAQLLYVYQCFLAAEDNEKDALRRLRVTFYTWMDNIVRSIDEELAKNRKEVME